MAKCEGGFEITDRPCPKCGATEKGRCRYAQNWHQRATEAEGNLDAISDELKSTLTHTVKPDVYMLIDRLRAIIDGDCPS